MKGLDAGMMVLMAVLMAGCGGVGGKVERAVTAALAPERPEGLTALGKSPHPTTQDVPKSIGADNFTCFLLAYGKEARENLARGYAWKFEAMQPVAMAQYLAKHATAVAAKDISGLQWTQQPDGTYSGSFSISTSYGLKATLLFAAREKDGDVEVTKLAVARKQSASLADGFTVFQK